MWSAQSQTQRLATERSRTSSKTGEDYEIKLRKTLWYGRCGKQELLSMDKVEMGCVGRLNDERKQVGGSNISVKCRLGDGERKLRAKKKKNWHVSDFWTSVTAPNFFVFLHPAGVLHLTTSLFSQQHNG